MEKIILSHDAIKFENYQSDLATVCTNGITELKIWKELYTFFKNNEEVFLWSPIAFSFMRNSLLESAVSNLCRLFDTHKDALSLHVFLKYIKDHIEIFPPETRGRVKEETEKSEWILLGKKTELSSLKTWRDKRLSHLDRKYAGDLIAIFRDYSLSIEQFDGLFDTAKEQINNFSKLYNNTTLLMVFVSLDFDLKVLFDHLRQIKAYPSFEKT